MNRSILLSFIILPGISIAQKNDTALKFLDANLQFTTEKNAVYYGLSIRKDNFWYFTALYPDTTPLIKASYIDKKLKIKEGLYTLYYPKYIKAEEGYYHHNKMNGVWRTWYSNGQLKDSGLLHNNQLVGIWKKWNENGSLLWSCTYKEEISPMQQKTIALLSDKNSGSLYGIKEGSYESWYLNGRKESSGTYKDDNIEGEWRWYHGNGSLSTIETYKEGKLTELRCFDTTGTETVDYCSIQKPALLKGYGDYKQFIFQYLEWPEEAIKKRIEGTVKVHVLVNKEGVLEKLDLVGEQPILKKCIEQLFSRMKEWYPAISHNRKVDWEDEVIIPFYR
jgi:antitoxin component YwqK of YwqJK toxin-antitoxin module